MMLAPTATAVNSTEAEVCPVEIETVDATVTFVGSELARLIVYRLGAGVVMLIVSVSVPPVFKTIVDGDNVPKVGSAGVVPSVVSNTLGINDVLQ